MIKIVVGEEEQGMRLDRLLRQRLKLQQLSAIYRLIRTGDVKVGGRKRKENYRLVLNDEVLIGLDPAELQSTQNHDSAPKKDLVKTRFFKENFSVLYEDSQLLACNKPPHIVVHSGTAHEGSDSIIEMARSYLLSKGDRGEPSLVHRLDRDTSGVILIAKTKRMLRELHELFRTDGVDKTYYVIVHGRPEKLKGTITAPLAQTSNRNEGMKVRVAQNGRPAVTEYSVESSSGGLSRARVVIRTGRTHQIRVHMAHLGCPVLGDPRYGDRTEDHEFFSRGVPRRMYLHAQRLEFKDPRSGKSVHITAALPPEFKSASLGF